MHETPKGPTGKHRDSGGAHLGAGELLRAGAAEVGKDKCRPRPEDSGKDVQRDREHQYGLHGEPCL
jgi:hypothetical protein